MSALPHRPLGASGLEVSPFALGSWRTYERIPREAGVAVLPQARESGIDFLEVARYNDESGTRTDPDRLLRGRLRRGLRARRAGRATRSTIATKLWWEFWPGRRPEEELAASLERTASIASTSSTPTRRRPSCRWPTSWPRWPSSSAAGRVRAWGIVNWPAERVAEAGRVARELGVAPPCAAQLPYSLIARDWVEGPEMTEALLACGAKVVASYVLAGGILSGKYAGGRRRPHGRRGRRAALGGRRARGPRARARSPTRWARSRPCWRWRSRC